MIEPGDIFERDGERIVVYRYREAITHKRHPKYFQQTDAVFFDRLDPPNPGGAVLGPNALGRFIGDWGQPVAKMSVAGAYKLYQRERQQRIKLQAEVDRLRHQISELG